MLLAERRGFTLIELMVVMSIFLIVMLVASNAFKTVLSQGGQQSKSIEMQIGSSIGLEHLRSDLQNAGFGLPFTFQSPPDTTRYSEITASDSGMPVGAGFWPAEMSPMSFNDASGSAPRALQSGNTTFNQDSDGVGSQYLVIKSMSVASGETQKKWVNVTYDISGKAVSSWGSPERDFAATDRVLVMRNSFANGNLNRELQVRSGEFSSSFDQYTSLVQPHAPGDHFQVYGVDPATAPRMPFNRADYYVHRPVKPPPACAPNTGILYKAVANQGAGFTEFPLLDCVADLQVVYGIGPVGSAKANFHQTALPGTGSAREIREQLKEIRIYILSQEGRKDIGFSFPTKLIDVGEDFGGGMLGRTFNLEDRIGAGWQNYRWKLYTIVARPINLTP